MIDALLVTIGSTRCAIPLEGVKEIIDIPKDGIHSPDGQTSIIDLRGHSIVVVDPEETFGIQRHETGMQRAVLLSNGVHRLAMAVDSVDGNDEVVVKALADEFQHVQGIGGATILGDGNVGLIIDPEFLYEHNRHDIAAA